MVISMSKGPKFNDISMSITTRDNLGIESVAASMQAELCPVVNTVTPRAFYWPFMVWNYYDFLTNTESDKWTLEDFDKPFLKKNDYFFVLSTLMTKNSDQNNLVGKDKTSNDLHANRSGKYDEREEMIATGYRKSKTIDYNIENGIKILISISNRFRNRKDIDETLLERGEDISISELTRLIDEFSNNLNQPIMEQLKDKISNVDKISIAVPFYDNELSALNEIQSVFPEAKFTLYIQDKKSKFPVKKKHKEITDIRVFNQIDTNNHFYHGKVFLFKNKEKSCIVYGSANCTQSALVKTKHSGGNIECDVIEYGTPNEFDGFFKNFKICTKAEPDCDIIESNREDNNNFFFRYGIVVGEKLDLFFGYKKKENATVKIGDNNLNCQYEGNSLKASLILDAYYPNNPFDIEVIYGNQAENLVAWYINPIVLNENRRKEAADYLDNYENEAKSTDKYLSDQIAILKSMALSWEEYERESDVLDIVEQRRSDTPEDDEESEGIIDYVIPAADIRTAYNKYLKVNKIKASFIQWYFKKFITETDSTSHSSTSEETGKRKPRKPTSDEIKFRRFVSRRLNELFNSDIEKYVSFENYLQITLVFVSILEKYTLIEKVEDLFDTQFVADAELGLLSRLLSMEIPDDKELSENVILLTLQTIINIHKAGLSDYIYELDNQKLLSTLDWIFDIRSRYKAYLNCISNKMDSYGSSFNIGNYISYFEQLFGYLPFNSLKKLIKEMYGQNTKVEIKDDLLLVETSSSNLGNHMVMSKKVMDEIRHYVYHYENPTRFVLIIHNTNVKFVRNGDPAVSVEYYVDFELGVLYQAINRMSGKREEQKDFGLR